MIKYTYKYLLIFTILFYLVNIKTFFVLNFKMLAIIPLMFFIIKYGILKEINKDHFMTKYYSLEWLLLITTVFLILFLLLNKVNIIVILFTIIVNALELIFLDAPEKTKKN